MKTECEGGPMGGVSATDSTVLGDLFGTAAMRAVFSDLARVQAMLDVEAALARAEASTGVIPKDAAGPIEAACRAEDYDFVELGRLTAIAGNPAIPLVRMLTARVAGDAKRYVHWGATSQDIIDSGTILQIRRGLDLLTADLAAVADAAARLADTHRETPMAGRTFLQHALPIPFGYKAAVWLGLAARAYGRLTALRHRGVCLQFGGAAGTLASLGADGMKVAEALARDLDLPLPDMPWHSARDRFADIGAAVAVAAGSMAKIATDIALMMQTEVGEVFEPAAEGKGGSSTMPHKRNPVGAAAAIAAATQAEARVPILLAALRTDHERGVGPWHAEWTALPEIFVLASGAVAHMRTALEGLTVDPQRMRDNLERTQGLIFTEAAMMALAPAIGRGAAHDKLEEASRHAIAARHHLRDVLMADRTVVDAIGAERIERLFDPTSQMGSADTFISRALDAWRKARGA
jgi:3-carboxy-cis,cis-muconate cycloisomerase